MKYGANMGTRGNYHNNSDEYYTPREIVQFLEKKLRERLQDKIILCPFDSAESEFVKVLTECGYKVVYTSDDYKNHLSELSDYCKNNDAVVFSNPPFSLQSEIVRNFKEYNIKFILFSNALWTHNAPELGIFARYIGSIVYKNGKGVPTVLISDEPFGDIRVRLGKTNDGPRKCEGFLFYPTRQMWIAAGKPDHCFVPSIFPAWEEADDYIMKRFDIPKFFNPIFIVRRD